MNVTRNIFSETPPVAAPFREDVPITLGDIQGLQLSETKRKECTIFFKLFIFLDFDNIKNFALRLAAGTIRPRNDFKFESASFQVRKVMRFYCLGIVLFSSYFQFI